jgi:hypothetical protein
LHNLPATAKLTSQSHPSFNIERARLRSSFPLLILFTLSVSIYGFSVEWGLPIPLTLQFVIAFAATAIFNVNSTLMIDLYPSKPASATAINNLMRCTVGAVGVGVVEMGIRAFDEGRVFAALAALSAMAGGLLVLEWRSGMRWRVERLRRLGVIGEDAELSELGGG